MRRWFGLKALVHDSIDATTALVREGNDATARLVLRVTDHVPVVAGAARGIEAVRQRQERLTLASVVAVNRVVEALTDLALDAAVSGEGAQEPPVPMRSDAMGTAAWVADASLGAVNGAIGDQLASRGNGLDLGLCLRHQDRYLARGEAPEDVGPRLVVLVHGLGVTEWSWCLDAEAYHGDPAAHFGSMLERDLGLVPIFARYNTGRPLVVNGLALAQALEEMIAAWPVPVEEIVLLGHSMGGLVARAACLSARSAGHRWLERVRTVVSLGSPHQGSPLAQLAQAATSGLASFDHPTTLILARLLGARSSGVKDLAQGALGEAPPLLDDVHYVFLSGSVTSDPAHPVSAFVGDLLVRVPSASGPLVNEGQFSIRAGTFGGVLHHQLQCHPDVYAEVVRRARPRRPGEPGP